MIYSFTRWDILFGRWTNPKVAENLEICSPDDNFCVLLAKEQQDATARWQKRYVPFRQFASELSWMILILILTSSNINNIVSYECIYNRFEEDFSLLS